MRLLLVIEGLNLAGWRRLMMRTWGFGDGYLSGVGVGVDVDAADEDGCEGCWPDCWRRILRRSEADLRLRLRVLMSLLY